MKKDTKNLNAFQDKINLDYDWNSEYGDGDIPDIDKNDANVQTSNKSSENKQKN